MSDLKHDCSSLVKFSEAIPYLPKNLSMAFVSGFGNTMKMMNQVLKTYKGFDWYFKGLGPTLVPDNEIIILPHNGEWGGVESEIIAIHSIDADKHPKYLGYTLGIDFTKTGMRRKNRQLTNLSHLSKTVISNHVICEPYPLNKVINTKIYREGQLVFNASGDAGKDNMFVAPEQLFGYLFDNTELIPGAIFYTLTGATISSDKAGISLQNGDEIELETDELKLSTTYLKENHS
ncbi:MULTISPECIES: hypothetical protein [Leuconostoc]|uniref:hypothetical protein n=1 Tax=Leuconostoc TaxID=1243 RepID=UPI0032DEE519